MPEPINSMIGFLRPIIGMNFYAKLSQHFISQSENYNVCTYMYRIKLYF